MSLNRLPTVEYDPGVAGIYVVIRSDAGYWVEGSTFDALLANATRVAVAEGDVPTVYRAAEADLAGLPAGDYEVIGFRPPNEGEVGDQYIGRDDDWRWDGDSGEALVETVEAGAAAAIEAAGLTAGGGGGGDGDGDTPMVVTLATNLAAPAAGARVWLTSDAAGANRLSETKAADDAGRVTFLVNAGVTYYVWSRGGGMADVLGEAVVGGAAASVVTTAASVDLSADSYLGVDEGRALLATLPSAGTPGAAELAACDDATFAAWLLMATIEVDADGPYQGRRYDPGQTLEFPRIPYGGFATLRTDRYGNAAGCTLNPGFEVWDWDAGANGGEGGAVVPAKVKTATLLQACDGASAAGQDRRGRAQAIADGLASQAVGSLSESYRADAQAAPLCLAARRILKFYRLRQGQLL